MQKLEIQERLLQISDLKTLDLTNNLITIIKRVDYVIERRYGLTSIFVGVGIDKSSLLHSLNDKYQSNENYITAFILASNSQTGFAFLKQICSIFGLELKHSFYDQYKVLENWLIQQYHNDKSIVIFIDDAENLTSKHLDVIRFLVKFEPFYQKLAQVVLIGTSHLKNKLLLSRNKDLLSRMVYSSSISAL